MKKTLKSVPVAEKDKLKKIDDELIKISGGDLDDLFNEVGKHEHYLDRMLETGHNNEEEYRQKHKEIAKKIELFDKRVRNLKKEIFDFVKTHKVNLQDASGI